MDYGTLIKEELEFLREQERKAVKAQVRDRIRFLRLLKSGEAKSQRASGVAVGLGQRWSQRLWQQYRQEGYAAFIEPGYQHNFGKLDCCQISRLQAFLRQDLAPRLEDSQHYIKQEFDVAYTISAICKLFQRLKIKRKTGRPVNVRKDAGKEEAFKKTLVS